MGCGCARSATVNHMSEPLSSFSAWTYRELRAQIDLRMNRVMFHGEAAMDRPCTDAGCPCGESGPWDREKYPGPGGLLNLS
jgi:hypothetical protein